MKACLFCKIIRDQTSRYTVYEDDGFVVLLDLYPVNPGHSLVVTKRHVESYYDLDDKLFTDLMLLVKTVSVAVKDVTNPVKVLMQTSGVGNKHVHVHVIPVYSMYDIIPKGVLDGMESEDKKASTEQLEGMCATLRAKLIGSA